MSKILKQSTSLTPRKLTLILSALLCTACGGSASGTAAPTTANTPVASCSVTQLESEMNSQLSQLATDTDFAFAVEREDGRRYVYQRGSFRMQTLVESASTSKLVSAVMILRLVEQGHLKLSERPQDRIVSWPITGGSSLSNMSLANLLSFTSGLTAEPLCINAGIANFETCVNTIANANIGNQIVPGTEFYYASTHLQVAGLMAVKARGVASWQDLFAEFKQQTGLFKTASFDLPSLNNPRLAGGMHWNGEEYLEFLSALKKGRLLNASSMNQLLTDHTANLKLVYSPAAALGETWHYGFGLWHECQSTSFNCAPAERVSSPGAYGAYPFWDRKKSYVGILTRQGELGTFTKGVAVERAIRPKVEAWLVCQP